MDKKEEQKKETDPIIAPLGDLGRWQLFVCLWVMLSKFPTGWVTLSIVILGAPPKGTCTKPENVTDICSSKCKEVEYSQEFFSNNMVTEWGLICEKKFLISLNQSLVMFGILVGSLVFGIISDRYGRRPGFLSCCMLLLVSGLAVSLSPNYWVFSLLRFLSAVGTGGIMVTSFVIIMEIIGKSKRELIAILYQIPFNLGHATLPLFAYFFRDWKSFHLSFSLFYFIYLTYFCLVPESPRWLLTTGQVDESSKVLELYARRNGKPTEQIHASLEEAYKNISSKQPTKKGTMVDLFRTRYLRLKTTVMAFCWLVVCMSYYGVAQYISNLSGDLFVNISVGAWLGAVGTFITVPMTIYLGRRYTLIISNLLSGVTLVALGILGFFQIPKIIEVILATIGLLGASITFPNVYLYGGELFPTVVRNQGVGLCSFLGRFGSIVAPYITQLGSFGMWIPPMFFGLFSLAAGILTFLLPETRGMPLPETLDDGENFGKKQN